MTIDKCTVNIFAALIAFIAVGILVFMMVYHRKKMKHVAQIMQQHEAHLQLKKRTSKQIENTETIEKEADPEKALRLKEISEKLLPELDRLFKEEKIYRQPRLSADDVAKMLNTNRTYLSLLFSECYQTRFSDYVNTFRVEDAIVMFNEMHEGGKYAHYTIQAIGEEVGFSGKTTFYTSFKQITGVAPSEYRRTLPQRKKE